MYKTTKTLALTLSALFLFSIVFAGTGQDLYQKDDSGIMSKTRLQQEESTIQALSHRTVNHPDIVPLTKSKPITDYEEIIQGYTLEELEGLPTGILKKFYEETEDFRILNIVTSRWHPSVSEKAGIRTPDTESEPNDDHTTANSITDSMSAAIDPGGDEDYFSFTAVAGTEYTFTTEDLPGSSDNVGDTKMYLYDTDGTTQLDYNDDIGYPNYYSQIAYTISADGTYYVKVTGYSSSNTGDYLLTMTSAAPQVDPYEPNNTLATATAIASGDSLVGPMIDPGGDIDIYVFTGSAGYSVSTQTCPVDGVTMDTKLYLLDADSIELAFNDDGGEGYLSWITGYELPADGTYYLKATGYSSSTTGSYNIELDLIAPSAYADVIIINEIMQNPSAVSDTYGEYVELANLSGADVDIEGWTFGDNDYESFIIHGDTTGYGYEGGGGSTIVPAGGFLVLGSSVDISINGGAPVDFEYGGYGEIDAITLANSSDEVILYDATGATVDIVEYDGGTIWPDPTGISMEFIPDSLAAGADNNTGTNWQEAWTTFGDGDYGTPGAANSVEPSFIPDEYEPNDSSSAAAYLSPGTYDLTLSETEDEYDWFWYPVGAGDIVGVSISFDDATLDFDLYIYDMFGNSLDYSAGYTSPEQVDYVFAADDTLYIMANAYSGAGDYTMTFTVTSPPITSPWADGFEDGEADGWTIIDDDANGYSWEVSTYGGNAYDGDYYMACGYNSAGNDDWLITPQMDVADNDIFSFWITNNSSYYQEEVEVWLSTTGGTAVADFDVRLDSLNIQEYYTYIQKSYDLSAYDGTTVTCALRSIGVNQYYTYADLFALTPAPPTGSVQGTVTDATSGSAIEGAVATAGGVSDTTDAAGAYLVEDISAGEQMIDISADGYQTASFTIVIVEGDTITQDAALASLTETVAYTNGFEAGDDLGWTYTGGTNGFVCSAGFTYTGSGASSVTVAPAVGDSFLVCTDAPEGYADDEFSWWMNLTDTEMDFSGLTSAKVDMRMWYMSESGWDYAYILANQPSVDGGTYYYLDVNGDGVGNSSDGLSGDSQGWVEISGDLSPWAGIPDVELAVLFYADGSFGGDNDEGFGVAVDSIVVTGTEGTVLAAPMNLTAESMLDASVPLAWEAPSPGRKVFNTQAVDMHGNAASGSSEEKIDPRANNHPQAVETSLEYNIDQVNRDLVSYNVFRMASGEDDFGYLANATDVSYTDSDVANGMGYWYYVTAVYDEGESGASNIAYAVPGAVTDSLLPYAQDFEGVAPNLPDGWSTENYGEHDWAVGDSTDADWIPSGSTDFAYIDDDAIGSGVSSSTVLVSPFFDCTSADAVFITFDSYGQDLASTTNMHVLVREGYSDWVLVDDLSYDHDDWESHSVNISSIASGKEHIQVGFFYDDGGQWAWYWAVDNFGIEAVSTGGIAGTVIYSEDGSPIAGATVELETGDIATTDTLGAYAFTDVPSGDYLIWASASNMETAFDSAHVVAAQTDTVNFVLYDFYLAPNGLAAIAGDGYVDLAWNEPPPQGEIAHDDGIINGTWVVSFDGGGAFTIEFPDLFDSTEYYLNALSVYTNSSGSGEYFENFSAAPGDSTPDLASAYFASGQTVVDPEWNFIYTGGVALTGGFWFTAEFALDPDMQAGIASAGGEFGYSYWTSDFATWNSADGLGVVWMMRAYVSDSNGRQFVLTSNGAKIPQDVVTFAAAQLDKEGKHRAMENGSLLANNFRAATVSVEGFRSFDGTYNVYRDEVLYASDITEEAFTDDAVENGTEYCYTVTAVYTEGESDHSNVACATPCVSITEFFSDFEADDGGLLSSGSWAWGTPTYPDTLEAFSGDNLWGTNLDGEYDNNEDSWLMMPCNVNLAALDNPVIGGANWFDIEEGWDYAYVVVDPDGDGIFDVMEEWTGIQDWWEWGYGMFDEEQAASEHAGVGVLLLTDGSFTDAGLYLDDLFISSGPAIEVSTDALADTLAPDETAEHAFTIENTGGLPFWYDLMVGYPWGDIDVLFSEDFEGGEIPADWTMTTNSAVGWFVTTDGSSTYWTVPPGDGYYACSNDDMANDDGGVDYLIMPAQDFSELGDVILSFDSYFTGAYSQTAHVEVSTDAGASWTEVMMLESNADWTNVGVDLSGYAGMSDVLIAFHSNDNGVWASGWAVDNVELGVATGGAGWLTLSADYGELEPGGADEIIVSMDAAGLEDGTYDATIWVVTDFSDDSIVVQMVVDDSVGVADGKAIPDVFALHQNFPNPFNPLTAVPYDVPEIADVKIDIYNILGQKVRTLVTGEHEPGFYRAIWNGKNDQGALVTTGVYIYRVTALSKASGEVAFTKTRKLVLMK